MNFLSSSSPARLTAARPGAVISLTRIFHEARSLLHEISGLTAALAAMAWIPPASAVAADTADAAAGAGSSIEHMAVVTVSEAPVVSDQYQLPSVIQSVTATKVEDTINAVDVEDAVKYLPSLFVRKRNYGDTQPVLATRTWGLNSSARSLIYADGVLLSALIANNNSIGSPRWGVVTPQEIERIDVIYGPFAAAYAGNSIGAVMEISTRMPDKPEATLTYTQAEQPFSLYSTHNTYPMYQTAVNVGDRIGRWSFWISANDEYTHSQPLTFVTAGTLPANTSGGYLGWNKLGQAADVLGAGNVQDTNLVSAKVKVAYDFSPTIRATYLIGRWNNLTNSTGQSYLRDASGQPTFGGVSGFASSFFNLVEEQTMQSLTVKSAGAGDWDWQATGSLFDFNKDSQNLAASVTPTGTGLGTAGKVSLLGGTGWSTLDLKAAWHPEGRKGGQELSFGVHGDEYKLVNPTYNTSNWQTNQTLTTLSTEGNGLTQTKAAWVQDAWQFAAPFKLTVGGRLEGWRAYDGINVNGATTVIQPGESSSNFSPKGTLAWTVAPAWTLTASAGNAYRYPTAGELYQLVSTGATYTSPNPNLKPEQVWSEEVRADHTLANGSVRLSLFEEDVSNALISQYNTLVPGSSIQYQYVMNVSKLRNRGAELYADQDNVLIHGLEFSGSITYVSSRILADSGQGQLYGSVGKRAPYVPMWRGTLVATYRPNQEWAFTLAGRYSGQQYSTVDNSDTNPDVYGGFDEFFVMDTHANWKFAKGWALSGGIDNLLNRKYFLFHPFPQRTFVAELKRNF
jgi:iron complex outermembrane receptor protein